MRQRRALREREEFPRRVGAVVAIGNRRNRGKQWRAWRASDGQEIDQVQDVIEQIRNNPASRRIIWDG